MAARFIVSKTKPAARDGRFCFYCLAEATIFNLDIRGLVMYPETKPMCSRWKSPCPNARVDGGERYVIGTLFSAGAARVLTAAAATVQASCPCSVVITSE